MRSIRFSVEGEPVAGHLHLPRNVSSGLPGVVVAGPMTSVKEQVTGVYAAALAARGVAALAIDHRHFGESGGMPRQYERWDRKVDDLVVALDWLAAQPEVSSDRIGLAAVCLGSGYAAHAAARSPLARALGLVAGYFRDPEEMRRQDPESFDARVAQGSAARDLFLATGEVQTIPAASLTGDAAMTSADTVDYYTRRAAVANYTNAFAVMSREYFLPFDVQAAAPQLTLPVRMVHSENALSPAWARRFHDRLRGPKELIFTQSRGQTDFYDDQDLVAAAADLLADHFHITLQERRP
ncbi:MAG: alpha/beta fold hydrolase [Rhizobium sp.]|nr:alpha/beta fold hydrolase [Rhizobium sp.]